MTDEERAKAWWDAQVTRAATTSECVDGPWEALAKLLRERDDALAKAAEAVRLREEDGAQLLAVESDLRKMTERAEKAEALVDVRNRQISQAADHIEDLTSKVEKAEAECERLREEMAHRVGIEDKIRHLIDPKGERICGTDTMVEAVLLDLKKWKDGAIDACAQVGSLRALCREAADEIYRQCPAHLLSKNPVYERLRKAGGET